MAQSSGARTRACRVETLLDTPLAYGHSLRTELAAVNEAESSLARGEGRIVTQESTREPAEQVKTVGRARLAAEQQTPR